MPDSLIMIILFSLFGIVETVFMVYVYRTVGAAKRDREAEYTLLDKERSSLLELQKSLLSDAQAARAATKDGLAKLQQIGLETHAEWNEMTTKIGEVVEEIEKRSSVLADDVLQRLNRKSLECKKMIELANIATGELGESIKSAKKVSRYFDSQVQIEDLLKDLRSEKYQEAKQLLVSGIDANTVAKRLGLSMSEVSLVSHTLTS